MIKLWHRTHRPHRTYRAHTPDRVRQPAPPAALSRTICLLVTLLLVGACEPADNRATPAVSTPADINVENVTLIDAVHPARTQRRVTIRDGRIQSISTMSEPAPPAHQTVDGKRGFLIPGLWDMHVHFVYEPALTRHMADLLLDYGITSVRDTGGNVEQLVTLRDGLQAGPKAAPNIYIAGPLLDGGLVVYDGNGRAPLGAANPDAATARQQIADLHAAGVDFIKIYELVTPEVFAAMVDSAGSLGLPIDAHVPLTMTADTAGPQVDSMEHLRNIELACSANWQSLLADRRKQISQWDGSGYDLRRTLHTQQRIPAINTFDEARCNTVLDTLTDTIQIPTLRLNMMRTLKPWLRPEWQAAFAGLPPELRTAWQAALDAIAAEPPADPTFSDWSTSLVGRMYTRGVPIGAGTDTPIGFGIPGESLHAELEQLTAAGLTPTDALHAATVQPARFFGLEDELGDITPGKRADLLLLRANPLDDISNTRSINRVMLAGRWVRGPAD